MRFLLLVFCLVTFFPMAAQAYIGPGLGIAVVWGLLGPIAALVMTVALIAYFPIRYYYKKHKAQKSAKGRGRKIRGFLVR